MIRQRTLAKQITRAMFRAQPDARVTVTGEVLAVRMQQPYSDLSPHMLVQTDDGHKLWGTRPVAFANVERGARISFSAEVHPSRDDPKFGFFSRPTKCRVS